MVKLADLAATISGDLQSSNDDFAVMDATILGTEIYFMVGMVGH